VIENARTIVIAAEHWRHADELVPSVRLSKCHDVAPPLGRRILQQPHEIVDLLRSQSFLRVSKGRHRQSQKARRSISNSCPSG
jgi:hypothetical protein